MIIIVLLNLFVTCSLSNQQYPRHVWMYWGGKVSEVVKPFIDRNIEIFRDMPIIFLNNKNIKFYVNFTSLPNHFHKLCPQHKADFYRIYLLKHYGGIWTDTTIYFKDSSFANRMHSEIQRSNSQLFAFSSHGKGNLYLENDFLIAPQNSTIMGKWLEEYTNAINKGFKNYIREKYNQGVILDSRLCTNNSQNTYLTSHVALQSAIQQNSLKDSVLSFPSEQGIFQLHSECQWNPKCIANRWKNDPKVKTLDSVKITGAVRRYIESPLSRLQSLKNFFAAAVMIFIVAIYAKKRRLTFKPAQADKGQYER